MVWVDRDGKEEQLSSRPMAFRNPEISPSGDRIAVTVGAPGEADIWVYDLARDTLARLTFDGGYQPTWRDDEQIIYSHPNSGQTHSVASKRANGMGEISTFGAQTGVILSSNYSASGHLTGISNDNLVVLPRDASESVSTLLETQSRELQPRLSDDGRWLAYTSDDSDRLEAYVLPFPDLNSGKWLVSEAGGGSPVWSRDGRELFYLTLTGEMMAVSVDPDQTGFVTGGTTRLFDASSYADWANVDGTLLPEFDVSPDGKRFLMIKPVQVPDRTAYVVVNWFNELARILPR